MTYTKTTFVEGSAPGISAIELNKLGDGIANSAQPDIDNAFSVAQTIQVVGDTIGMILGFGGSGNYQIRTNDNGADAQQNATLPSWAFALQEGASDNVTFYRKPAGGAIAQLFRLDNAGQLYLVDGTKTVWHLGNLPAPAQTNVDNAFSVDQSFNGKIKFPTGYFDTNGNHWANAGAAAGTSIGWLDTNGFEVVTIYTDGSKHVVIPNGIDTANNGQYIQFKQVGNVPQMQVNGGGFKPVGGYTSSRKGTYSLAASTNATVLSLSGAGMLNTLFFNNSASSSGQGYITITVDGITYISAVQLPIYGAGFIDANGTPQNSTSTNSMLANISFESSLTISISSNTYNGATTFDYTYGLA